MLHLVYDISHFEVKIMKKLLGEDRRLELLSLLKNAKQPLTGNDLSKHTNVSRQVTVMNMNLLKRFLIE